MNREQARAELQKLVDSYKRKLSLAQYYSDPRRGGSDRDDPFGKNADQRKKAKKYENILTALAIALEHMENT